MSNWISWYRFLRWVRAKRKQIWKKWILVFGVQGERSDLVIVSLYIGSKFIRQRVLQLKYYKEKSKDGVKKWFLKKEDSKKWLNVSVVQKSKKRKNGLNPKQKGFIETKQTHESDWIGEGNWNAFHHVFLKLYVNI